LSFREGGDAGCDKEENDEEEDEDKISTRR
jgi:hypothetical protein